MHQGESKEPPYQARWLETLKQKRKLCFGSNLPRIETFGSRGTDAVSGPVASPLFADVPDADIVIVQDIHLSSIAKMICEESMDENSMLLTIFFRHDQAKNLDQIQAYLKTSGFWEEFPPAGVEIVTWYVMMGIGHVVTLRLPPEKLREVNIAIEKRAWPVFHTEVYTTYDFSSHRKEFAAK
jgi:hypothetical protein